MKVTTFAACALCAAQSAQAASLVTLLGSTPGTQSLNRFDSTTPGALNLVSVSGLASGESLLGIDFRPLNGQLFGLGSASNLYILNSTSGVASLVGSGLSSGIITATNYGFDFNPTIDRIRIVSTDNSNSVANPITGATQLIATSVFFPSGDANSGANPNLAHHAYTNNFAGATTSQLYALDSDLDALVTQANNAGTLGTVAPLTSGGSPLNFGEAGGFDIAADGTAFAALSVGSASSLYTINLTNGVTTNLGTLSGNVTGLAVVPEPSSALLLGCGALTLLRRKRSV
jgi:Domain of unknown function (DUF4394)